MGLRIHFREGPQRFHALSSTINRTVAFTRVPKTARVFLFAKSPVQRTH